MRILLMVVVGIGLLTIIDGAEAAGRRRMAGPSKQVQAAAMGRAMYPKYYHGIHARQLQNIGVPSGDIGLRGNGYMMNAW